MFSSVSLHKCLREVFVGHFSTQKGLLTPKISQAIKSMRLKWIICFHQAYISFLWSFPENVASQVQNFKVIETCTQKIIELYGTWKSSNPAPNLQMRKLKFPIARILYFYQAAKDYTHFFTSQNGTVGSMELVANLKPMVFFI